MNIGISVNSYDEEIKKKTHMIVLKSYIRKKTNISELKYYS